MNQIAEEYYEKSIKADPKSGLPLRWIALFYWKHGTITKALTFLLREYDLDKEASEDNAELLGLIGRCYLQSHQLDLSEKYLLQSLDVNQLAFVASSYAHLLWQKSEKQKAIEYFYKAVQLEPANIEYKSNFACALWTYSKEKGTISGKLLMQVHAAFKEVTEKLEGSDKNYDPTFAALYREYAQVYQKVIRILLMKSNVNVEDLMFQVSA